MKKILIANTYGIGDVLFSTPFLKNLRLAYPKAHITYLCNLRAKDILSTNPDINELKIYERSQWYARYKKNPVDYYWGWVKFIQELRHEQYDVVFDFSLNASVGFWWIMAGIPKRIGYDFKGRGQWLNVKLPLQGFEDRPVVQHYLDLLRLLNIPTAVESMQLTIPQEDIQWAKEALIPIGHHRPCVALVLGGGASWGKEGKYRRWSIDKFAQLADKIVEQLNAVVILVGDSSEADLAKELLVMVKHPMVNLVGQTSLMQMAALFKSCRMVVGNDSGSLHIAVAAGSHVVSIFGPVDPIVYGPYPVQGHVAVHTKLPCQPCYRRFRMTNCQHTSCLRDLTIEEVFTTVSVIFSRKV